MTKILTTTESHPHEQRPRVFGVAVALAATLALAACSGNVDGTSSTVASTGPRVAASTTSVVVDPQAALDTALTAYATGYHFKVTAVVNAQTASVIEGRAVGGAAAFTVQSGDASVEYVVTSQGRWVRNVGSEWNLLAEAPPPTDPLVAVATPLAIEVASADGATMVLRAEYAAFTADLTLNTGLLVAANYEITDQGVVSTVVTEFAPLGDTTPITAPPVDG